MTLERFHLAQGQGPGSAYALALAELRSGCKKSHWIWFVLPQLKSLGRSPMSQRYGIDGLTEARAYLADPVLRERYEAVTATITDQLQQPGQTLERLMDGELDAAKTISSLTLFAAAGLTSAGALLKQLGRECPLTRAQLHG
ncbi:MAG: DUF1810 family protein [Synechococcaceae cyanobacterium]|nr:DUF1810 family protein [Synechococcaceae cyanobacterium]